MVNCGNQMDEVLYVVPILLEMLDQKILFIHHMCQQYFPKSTKKKCSNEEHQVARYQRNIKRQKVNKSSDPLSSVADNFENMNQIKTINHVSTQITFKDNLNENFVFSCEFIGSDICTQATIANINVFNISPPLVVDKSCGPNSFQADSCPSCKKFHGFENIKDENQLRNLTGVTFKVFNFLLV